MELSNCCDAQRLAELESDICSECREHADFIKKETLIVCDYCSNKVDQWIEIEGFEFCDELCEGNFYQNRNNNKQP